MNKKILRLIIILIIAAVLIIVWAYKNRETDVLPQPQQTDIAGGENLVEETNDFSLEVDANFDLEKLKEYNLPIMISFGADFCPACKVMAPVLKEFYEDMKDKVIVKYIDTDKNRSLSSNFPVSVIPTQIFIDNEGNPYNPSDENGANMKLYQSRETGEHIFTAYEGAMTRQQLNSIFREMGVEIDD